MKLGRIRPRLARLLGPSEVTCTLFDGQRLRVVLPEIVATELYLHGFIEPALTRLLLDRLRPGMVFVDVGAQYGYFALLASRLVGPSGRLVAFEPGREAARLLRRNVGHIDQVVVEQVAVTDRTGTARLLDFGPKQSALNTVLDAARVPPGERARLRPQPYDVRTVSLDDYVAEHDLRPDFVKLDAEGAELSILSGMRATLREFAPMVALETGDYEGMASPPTTASIDLLERMDYRPFDLDGGLRPHERRGNYGYGTLVFARD